MENSTFGISCSIYSLFPHSTSSIIENHTPIQVIDSRLTKEMSPADAVDSNEKGRTNHLHWSAGLSFKQTY